MNESRVIKRYTLEDLADELHSDIMITWKLLQKHGIHAQESEVSRTRFFYYLSDNQLSLLTLETDHWYDKQEQTK